MTNSSDVTSIARHLHETLGTRAIPEAAQKASSYESSGDPEQARMWRRVQEILQEMRGPRES